MKGVSREHAILAGILICINVVGLVCIHHDLTGSPIASARIISLAALPNVDRADRITVAFDRSMVQADDVGEIEKASIFALEPDWPGKWVWSAPDKAEYLLSDPLPPGRSFKLVATEELVQRTGRKLEGQSEFKVETQPLFMDRCEIMTFDQQNVTLRLVFNQPVNPGDLLRHINLYYDDKTTSKLNEPQCLTKTTEKELVLRFDRPGSDYVRMVLDKKFTGDGAELGLGKDVIWFSQIPKSFSLLNAYASKPRLDRSASIRLNFSHELDRDQKTPELTINPSVERIIVHRSGNSLVVSGDFEPGRKYVIGIPATLLSIEQKTLGQDTSVTVEIPEYEPEFRFTYSMGVMSPLGHLTLDARGVNIEGLRILAWRVHQNNLIYHLQGGGVYATSRSLMDKEIELDMPPGEPRDLTLDLQDIMPITTGIYSIQANATNSRWTCDRSLVTITDLAITTKTEADGCLVWVTSLCGGGSVGGAEVKAVTYNNQIIASATTDTNGIARLRYAGRNPDGKMWVITAQKDGDLSYIQPSNEQWMNDNVGQFGRAYVETYEVMMYTERGVYRPGDTINLTGIIRQADGCIPPAFPLEVKVTRPDGRKIADIPIKQFDSNQGVFHVEFCTRSDGQTGAYGFRVTLPGSDETIGSTQSLVEAFVPIRMEVKSKPAAERFGPNTPPEIDVSARYLWDEPASDLPVTLEGTLRLIRFESKAYPDFHFGQKINQRPITLPQSTGALDKTGQARIQIALPESLDTSLYTGWVSSTVTEPGGRSVSSNTVFTLDMLDRHIGLRLPAGQLAPVGKPVWIDWVRRTGQDEPVTDGNVTMHLVRVGYDTVLKMVDDRRVWQSTEQIHEVTEEKVIAIGGSDGGFEITCPDPGCYRAILTDVNSGSSSYLEFYASEYASSQQNLSMNQPERLEIVTDKEKYLPGQTAKVLIRSPIPGTFLLTVENDHIVDSRIGVIKENTAELDLPLPYHLRGSMFLTATVVKAVDPQQENWLPHRAMGVTCVRLDHSSKKLPLEIKGPEKAQPGDTVSVTVNTGKPADPNCLTSVHLWAVDEGILLTTAFETPDPYSFFLGPRRLGVFSADIFNRLLPDFKRPVGAVRIGADDFDIGNLRRNPVPAKQRKPAVIWRKVMSTDENGQATAEFKLPDLIGQMRFMAVAIDHGRYGSSEQAITLTSPLIVEASWPRFVAPGDSFNVPVKLFNSTDRSLSVRIKTEITGPVEVSSEEGLDKVAVEPGQPKTLMLKAVSNGIGTVGALVDVIEVGDSNEPLRAHHLGHFTVRPSTALHNEIAIKAVKAGESLRIEPSDVFCEGTIKTTVSVSSRPSVQLGPALENLIHYPYGCVEQTSSQLYALLYAPGVLGDDRAEAIKGMVTAGISRLWSMQTRSGGLSYWPGGTRPCLWGTAYACSCLVGAVGAGYEIEPQFISELTQYLGSRLNATDDDNPGLNTKALICRVLAVFGKPPHGWMARLAEQKDQLDLEALAHLAGAFNASGRKDIALSLLPEQPPQALAETTTSGRLTSPVRQIAVLLSALLEIEPEHPVVAILARRLDDMRQNCQWGSTLNNASAITALCRYQTTFSTDKQEFSGTILLADNEVAVFDQNHPIEHTFANVSQPITVSCAGDGTAYTTIVSEGLAKEGVVKPYNHNLNVERSWTNSQGNPIDPNNLSVGDLICVSIKIKSPNPTVHNIVIVDALPGGTEVENPRLATSAINGRQGGDIPDHVEFLDDRVVLFCSADKQAKVFNYALRVTTEGQFSLPPIQASCMYDPAVASLGQEGRIVVNGIRNSSAKQ